MAPAPRCGSPGRPRAGLRPACRLELHRRARRRDHADLRGGGEETAGRKRDWEVRSAGQGSKGERWYAWAWLATASPRHLLLVRRHLKTGELAFHYCYIPAGQLASKARLIRAAGLRWPVRKLELAQGCFGLDQCQARLYTAILRHIVLVMAAFAVCAVIAAMLRDRTGTQALPPTGPDAAPPASLGLIPLTVREIRRLLARAVAHPEPPGQLDQADPSAARTPRRRAARPAGSGARPVRPAGPGLGRR